MYFPEDFQVLQQETNKTLSNIRYGEIDGFAQDVYERLSVDRQRLIDIACEKGASSWLFALPIREHGFDLHKGAFRDAICIRYGWRPSQLPCLCVCGYSFSIDHALSCKFGGYPIKRHNEQINLTASLLNEVSSNVRIELPLQQLTGEQFRCRSANTEDGARLDVAADGFWGTAGQRAFFNVCVFNPLAPSQQNVPLSTLYHRHEQDKKREYDERVREVEFGCFSPLIFLTAGGLGPISIVVYKRIATLTAEKLGKPYSTVMNFIRCKLSFSLLRSTISCLRGTRSKLFDYHTSLTNNIDLALTEGRIYAM